MEWNMEWNTAWNGSLEQMHGTELERKYFVWNSCMEQKSGTVAEYFVWNRCMEQSWNGNLRKNRRTERTEHGTEVDIPPRTKSRFYLDVAMQYVTSP